MMTQSVIESPLTRYQGVDTRLRTPGGPRPPYRMERADAGTGCWVWQLQPSVASTHLVRCSGL
jgi:hypothetical protein